jgi:hypothetical protein
MIDIHFSYFATLTLEKIKFLTLPQFVDLESIVMNTSSMKKYSKSSIENLKKNESFVKHELLWMLLSFRLLGAPKTKQNLVTQKCIAQRNEITTTSEQKLILPSMINHD